LCLILSTLFLLSDKSAQILTLRAILVDASSRVTGRFNYFSELFYAIEDNRLLKEENLRLHFENSLLQENQLQIARLKELLELKENSPYELKAGSIIAWGSVPIPNTVTINLGESDGIRKNCPVISSSGLVGKIKETGKNSSLCQLLTDRSFRVSAVLRKTGAYGLLRWKQDNKAVMDEVLKNSRVIVGDTVITSEHGNIYPRGIPIGIVDSYADGPDLFKIVNVRLFVDYLQLRDICVITGGKPKK